MFAVVLGVNAQRRMQVWEGNTYMQFFTTDVDSVTFLSFPEGILQECEEIHDTIIKTITMHDTVTLTVRDTITKTITVRDTITQIVKDTVYIQYCPDTVSDKPLASAFSVSANKKISFAKGNLQYQANTKTWRFAENQYDIIGINNENISNTTYEGWIDLFGWGTGNHPTDTSTNNSDYQTFVDWGNNAIGADAPNTWRTLSANEWLYIIYTRSNAKELFGFGSVNGVTGMILLSDDWITPDDIVFTSAVENGLRKGNGVYSWVYEGEHYNHFSDNSYHISDWQKMENAGAVFLPVAGYRYGKEVIFDEQGCYLTSTGGEDGSCAYGMDFRSWIFFAYHCYSRRCGFPVRLVKDVK